MKHKRGCFCPGPFSKPLGLLARYLTEEYPGPRPSPPGRITPGVIKTDRNSRINTGAHSQTARGVRFVGWAGYCHLPFGPQWHMPEAWSLACPFESVTKRKNNGWPAAPAGCGCSGFVKATRHLSPLHLRRAYPRWAYKGGWWGS